MEESGTRIISENEGQTQDIARNMAQHINSGDILLLHGDLGMGKSVFCRALIRALCHDEAMEVPSPTFTLVQTYEAEKGTIWHFDLYRLADPDEIYETGWEEALAGGIVLVEWPERLGSLKPIRYTEITFLGVIGQPDHRLIEVEKHGRA